MRNIFPMFNAAADSTHIAWVLTASFLVMLMQAGFCLLETGFARSKNSINVAIKNLVDFLISSLLYWGFGFALMFGVSQAGLFGTSCFAPGIEYGPIFLSALFFQLMFCSTSTTIISGAVAERIKFSAYVITAIVVSGLIYPVFGHWAWGGMIEQEPTGWLAKLGFLDFAGSTVVHSAGGWISLAMCLLIGPRIGRFDKDAPPMTGHNLPMSTIGVMILWFGWFGFNGGSALGLTYVVPLVLLNTNLAAAAGGIAALALTWSCDRRPNVGATINGVIGGLVAITASCNIVDPLAAVAIGVIGGALSVAGTVLLERWKIDDVVGAIPVHGMCGAWGTLAVALFGDVAKFAPGAGRLEQFGIQLLGVVTCFAWTFGVTWLVLGAMHRRWNFRVSPEGELEGLNVSEHGASTELVELLTNMDRHSREGEFGRPVPVEPHTEVGQIAAEYNRVLRRAQAELRAREEAVRATRSAEEKYRGIFENAVEGIFQTTPDGRYLSANPALATIYGYASADDLIASLGDIGTMLYVDPARRDEFRRMIETDGLVVGFESEVRRRNGETIWISENARAIRDIDGNVHFYEGTVVDVTERRRAGDMKRQMEAAEAANQAKSAFLANMSHEVRTPLNGVMGMLELLNTTQLDDRQRRFVHLATSSADALLGLINQILDFSKIEAGKLELERVDFVLRPMIEDLADVLGHKAHQKQVELACRIHADVPDAVAGDRERVRQVLVNLVNNAVKFTDRGCVELEVSVESVESDQTRVRFEVRDSGIGVPVDRRDRLFQPFTQVDASTTRKYGGTGLGLSICKQLVEAMGGEIGYAPRIGDGSVFRFSIPLERRADASARGLRTPPERLQGLRTLAVDDAEVNRELLGELLPRWGLHLDTAADAQAALDMVRRASAAGAPYQLVMLDRRLPDMDGLELAEFIQRDTAHADAQLLLLTSSSETPSREDLQHFGIADVLYKPLRQSQLFDTLITLTDEEGPPMPSVERRVAESASRSSPLNTAARLLVAEDNEVNRMVTAEILRTAGYRCDFAVNGREAVDRLAAGRYDLVLMDCQMPVLDGFSAVAEIRRREAEGESFAAGPIPIVALTANAVRGDRERCLAAGMNGYVSKPIDREQLLAEVRRLSLDRGAVAPSAEANSAPVEVERRVETEPTSPLDRMAKLSEVLNSNDLLSRCQGDRQFASRLLEKFRRRLPIELQQLEDAGREGDVEAIRRVAHQLKGSAGNVGASSLSQCAAAVELDTARPEASIERHVDVLRIEMTSCLDAVDALITEFCRA